MEVSECVMTDWYEPGKHTYRWPSEEAAEEDKSAFQKLVNVGKKDATSEASGGTPQKKDEVKTDSNVTKATVRGSPSREEKATLHTHSASGLSEEVADAPAAKVRLTVSSGFYVRSFAHDLGLSCDSYGTMPELARTRQADFTTMGPPADDLVPALEYADIEKGEEVWGPKITEVLDAWLTKNPAQNSGSSDQHKQSSYHNGRKQDWRGGRRDNRRDDRPSYQKRRNSSSPE